MSAVATAIPPGRDAVDRRGIGVLACGHACVDMAQGAVPALLPFLIHHRGYSYAAAAALVLAMTITSSLIQPVFGHYADRRSLPWLLPGGVLVAGIGISLSGLMSSYPLTFAAVALAGVGVGAYHPEAARYANYVSGSRRASGMSLFSVGGNLGFALGPVLVTPIVLLFGLSGTPWLILPYLAVCAVMTASLPAPPFLPARCSAQLGAQSIDVRAPARAGSVETVLARRRRCRVSLRRLLRTAGIHPVVFHLPLRRQHRPGQRCPDRAAPFGCRGHAGRRAAGRSRRPSTDPDRAAWRCCRR